MDTTAQIEANRRNGAHSTGPKSASGKAQHARKCTQTRHDRANRHARTATGRKTSALEERIQQTIAAMQPRTPMEQDLVERTVRLSADIDRAERIGTAHLAHRVRKATILDPKEFCRTARSGRCTSSAPSSSTRRRSGQGMPMPRPMIIRR